MLRSTPAAGRCRRRRWPRAISFLRTISNRFYKRWCAHGILKGIRGPHGGYKLGREHKRITAEDILRAANSAEDVDAPPLPASVPVNNVVRPVLIEAERTFSAALGQINVEDMAKRAEALK